MSGSIGGSTVPRTAHNTNPGGCPRAGSPPDNLVSRHREFE